MLCKKIIRFCFLFSLIYVSVLSLGNNAKAEQIHKLSLKFDKVVYEYFPVVRLVVNFPEDFELSKSDEIVFLKDMKEDIKDIVSESIEKRKVTYWLWVSQPDTIYQIKIYSEDETLIAYSPRIEIDSKEFSPQKQIISLKQKQVISDKLGIRVDKKTKKINLYVNNKLVSSQKVLNNEKYVFFSIPDNGNKLKKIQFVSENIWGKTRSEKFTVLNIKEEIPYKEFIFVDKTNFRLYLIKENLIHSSYPIAIGTRKTRTPTGFFIIKKKEDMHPPTTSWGVLRLLIYRKDTNRWSGYAIHGTNKPSSIGKEASHGCVRMYNENVIELEKLVSIGTAVLIME